jgi:hypothetical protein
MGLLASDASNLRGSASALDGLERVDVVTDPVGGVDTMRAMSVDDERFDWAELAREKQASRDEDARALASGEKSLEQLREENEVFARVFANARINLTASESLG